MREFSQRYRDYRIDFVCEPLIIPGTYPYPRAVDPKKVIYRCEYSILKNIKREFSFRFMGTLEWFRSLDESEFNRFRNHGFDIACGLIDTERYKKFKEGEMSEFDAEEYEIPKKSEIPDEKMQHEILKALYKIRRENPENFETAEFNENGFCKVLRITKDDFSYNSGCLKERGLIKFENGRKSITIEGIKELE